MTRLEQLKRERTRLEQEIKQLERQKPAIDPRSALEKMARGRHANHEEWLKHKGKR
jgi:cell division protein FtsB